MPIGCSSSDKATAKIYTLYTRRTIEKITTVAHYFFSIKSFKSLVLALAPAAIKASRTAVWFDSAATCTALDPPFIVTSRLTLP